MTFSVQEMVKDTERKAYLVINGEGKTVREYRYYDTAVLDCTLLNKHMGDAAGYFADYNRLIRVG
jgi:hypothetical protein